MCRPSFLPFLPFLSLLHVMASPNSNASESQSASDSVGLSQHTPSVSGAGALPTTADTRAKHRIAALEDELEIMQQERGMKQRKTTYYIAQGREICRLVTLYATLEDLISENDCWQDCMQCGYIKLSWTLPWLHRKLGTLEHEDCEDMLKKLKKGADAARGDNTSCLKDLVAAWVNQEFRPSPLIKPDDKHLRGFVSNVCGKLLCPADWDWDQNRIKVDICNRMSECIVSENSWPLFLYENYTVNCENLEEGLFKSKLLVQAFKAIFTSPSSAKEAKGDGDGADILENNRHTQWKSDQAKVKTCIASIINMKKVTSRAIAYVVCQVHFALSNMSSWHTVDGDFDYEGFWNNIVDFFEDIPGSITKHRVDKLLEWWTRKIFGTNHHEDLTPDVVSQMSVNTLAQQRKVLEDAAFDSD
ncbi:uncharacterized protein EDB91DRAFT_1088934 [Suillus paluster]|uniref:uncharacterized protein n=1 Tax=Suillus paluster TaxID=48578 RepID=UPI001B862C60|nr:uncharacterized protein EDB91DRAFT_1088934 [Suillus paluster]KAG1720163.1 hypothetical protein EDB91DRAFT_1088934 [Suillus paluster]